MSGMPQLASNDTYRDGCVSNKVHHVTKITESNYSQYKGDTLFGTKYNLIQTRKIIHLENGKSRVVNIEFKILIRMNGNILMTLIL